MLPNTEHAPVHIADVITAIGRLRKAKMDTRAISAALGYAELEIERLEALSTVHADVLKALRQGRLTLKQVRLFARLPDKTQQAEIAQTALPPRTACCLCRARPLPRSSSVYHPGGRARQIAILFGFCR